MLRYKTKTRPGLVALYDIRPGNGAGQFLQPRSPHGAFACVTAMTLYAMQYLWRRCDCLASSAPFTSIQTYLLTYLIAEMMVVGTELTTIVNVLTIFNRRPWIHEQE